MKQRVNLTLEPTVYKMLRVMAAEEGISMSDVVTEFVQGTRQNYPGHDKQAAEEALARQNELVDEFNVEQEKLTSEKTMS